VVHPTRPATRPATRQPTTASASPRYDRSAMPRLPDPMCPVARIVEP
jgi:hypothetical protein